MGEQDFVPQAGTELGRRDQRRLIFVINVFRDEHLAERLVGQLSEHYPETKVVLIPDEPRLKHILTGEWTQRWLEMGLETGADTIIKLDPDTCVWRRARVPIADYFGAVNKEAGYVLGGACGVSQSAARRMIDSGLLPRVTPHFYERYNRYRWPHEGQDDTPLSCQDLTLGDAMRLLGIAPTRWRDVRIFGNTGVVPRPGSRAITHPHPVLC